MTIYDILKDSAYKTEQFSQTSIILHSVKSLQNCDKHQMNCQLLSFEVGSVIGLTSLNWHLKLLSQKIFLTDMRQ